MPGSCGCRNSTSSTPFTVVTQDGTEIDYRSEVAARAFVRRNPGSYLKPPATPNPQ